MINMVKKVLEKMKFSRNTGPKIASVFCAVLLWFYVVDVENPEMVKTFRDVKIDILNENLLVERDLVFMNDEDFFADVTIIGRRNSVIKFREDRIKLSVDLRALQKGETTVQVDVNLGTESIKIEKISVSEVDVIIDRIVEVEKMVKVKVEGDVPDDFTHESLVATPMQLTVSGPEKYVNRVAWIEGLLDITNKREGIEEEINVLPVDADGNVLDNVQLSSNAVSVEIAVYRLKMVDVAKQIVGIPADGYRLVNAEIAPMKVRIKGDDQSIQDVTELQTQAIDINGLDASKKIAANFIMPDGVELIDPAMSVMVDLTIEKIKRKQMLYFDSEIIFENKGENLELAIVSEDQMHTVNVEGIESHVDEIIKTDVRIRADLNGLEAGIHEVPVRYFANGKFDSVVFTPDVIKIELTEKTVQ